MALMNALHEYCEVWLPPAEGSDELLEALWVHRSTVRGKDATSSEKGDSSLPGNLMICRIAGVAKCQTWRTGLFVPVNALGVSDISNMKHVGRHD